MAPKYIVHYYDFPSRGEQIRVVFNHAGVPFEDKRYQLKDHPSIKQNDKLFPLGQLPVLQVDDQLIVQSLTIMRYLAEEFNLNGKSSKDRAIINQVVDTLQNIEQTLWGAYFWKPNFEEKKKAVKEMFEGYAPRAFKMIENFLKESGKDFLVGDEITIADIHIMVALETIQLDHNLDEYKSFLDAYPLVKSLKERVRNSDNIKKYLDKRGPPKYPFVKKE